MDAGTTDGRIRQLDPFGYLTGHASVIRPLGGSEKGPDPRYAFHTPYVEFRPGRVIFSIRFTDLHASFGELRVFVHAFVPGSGRDAVFVTSSRLDLADRAAVERGLVISFMGVAGASYAAYGVCGEGTDAQAAGLSVTAEQPETSEFDSSEGFLLRTRLETPPLGLPARLLTNEQPSFRDPVSQLMTDNQLIEPDLRRWLDRIPNQPASAAAGWRFAFIAQALDRYGMLRKGARGITLGGGGIALGPILVAAGCEAMVGWLSPEHGASDFAWTDVGCRRLDPAGVPEAQGRQLALHNEPADTRGFDFMWTIGAAELGYAAGHTANFLFEIMTVLRPGGFAVHMLDMAPPGRDAPPSLPRAEIERLAVTLISRGFTVAQLAFGIDRPTDPRPFGLIVRKD